MSSAAHPISSRGPAAKEITLSVVTSINNEPTVVAEVPPVNLHDPVRFVPALHSDKIKVEMQINQDTGQRDTPFSDQDGPVFQIGDSQPREAQKEGLFVFNCTIIRDGQEIGWGTAAGGEIPIPPR